MYHDESCHDPRATRAARLLTFSCGLPLFAAPALAGGTIETVRSLSVPLTSTNWTAGSVEVPRVDPSLGRLVEVRVSFAMSGAIRIQLENQSSLPIGPIFVGASVIAEMRGPTGEALASGGYSSQLPTLSFPPFDGAVDFMGPSGATVDDAFMEQVELRYFPGDPLANLFVGPSGNPGIASIGTAAIGDTAISAPEGLLSVAFPPEVAVVWTVTVVQDLIDCNDNGIGDGSDISTGASLDQDGNSFPDECQGDADDDGVPDTLDADCLGPGPDADGDGILDACETTPDCDNDGIPDAFEVDRNHNGLDDACEFGSDCNTNGLPDALDLAAGISVDLDRNLVPDECQSSLLGFYAEADCQPQELCPGFGGTGEVAVDLAVTGSCRLPEDRFSIAGLHLPAGRPALLVGGVRGVPIFGAGGARCVSGPRRLGAVVADSNGTASWSIDRSLLENALGVRPWDRLAYQVAYRRSTAVGPVLAWSSALQVRHLP